MKLEIIKHRSTSRYRAYIGDIFGIYKILAPSGYINTKTQNRPLWHVECILCGSIMQQCISKREFKRKKCVHCRSKKYFFKDGFYTARELADKYAINYTTINKRLKRGMDVESALEIRKKISKIKYQGQMLRISEIARILNIPVKNLYRRYADGRRGRDLFLTTSLRRTNIIKMKLKLKVKGKEKEMGVLDFSKKFNIYIGTVYKKIKEGWSVNEILSLPPLRKRKK